MRILSFSGDLSCDRENGRRLRYASADVTTIIDLSGVTHLGEVFAQELFRFLNRSIKANAGGAILVAQGNIARKLRTYRIHFLVRIIDENDLVEESSAA